MPAEPRRYLLDLAGYLAAQDHRRDDRVNRALDALSDREKRLVREAAVMGYVQGAMAANPGKRPDIPKDSAIVWQVVDACRAFPDLYPVISALADEEARDA
ncbi:hypothetical protein OG884_18555 [Streptosporangium sp. NBC_01755]|uniref:hypothetical protein n=1 Tax=Streptosporangium sp. NBC_01755 TaxID=2975949 RepID=UPI002DD868AB|nr:hypothetical protein [Streptosporangium sp. NBC_01755]WSD03809.1 hypothetical protein OG884_18555 [Streptosporangium sp. NBC_01755]